MRELIILLISTSSLILSVKCDCINLLTLYYKCNLLNYTIGNGLYPSISFQTSFQTLDNTYLQNDLNKYTTLDQVMEFYRSIVSQNYKCSTDKCKCINFNKEVDQMAVIFNKTNYFQDFKNIIQEFKNKYTPTTNFGQFPSNSSLYPIYRFCSVNSYFYDLFYGYPQAFECLFNPFVNTYDAQCKNDSGFYTNNSQMIITNMVKFQAYIKCVLLKLGCGTEMNRLYMVGLIMNYNISFTGELSDYINYMFGTNVVTAVSMRSVWIGSDPQIYSTSNYHQICNFNSTLYCLQSNPLTVNCTAKSIGSLSVTYLSSVILQFNIKNLKYYYIANDVSFPSTFTNNLSIITDSSGNKILEISSPSSNRITIIDYVDNLALSLGKWSDFYFFILRAPETIFTYGSGILVEGCPSQYLGSFFRRRKRALSSDVEAACALKAQANTGDDAMNSTTIYNMCVYDVTSTNNISLAGMAGAIADAAKQLKLTDSILFGNNAKSLAITHHIVLIGITFILPFFLFY